MLKNKEHYLPPVKQCNIAQNFVVDLYLQEIIEVTFEQNIFDFTDYIVYKLPKFKAWRGSTFDIFDNKCIMSLQISNLL